MGLSEKIIERGYFEKLKSRIRHNYQIADFYFDRYEITGEEKFLRKSVIIGLCCKYFDLDVYNLLQIKDVKRVNLCKDKFCFNCQSSLANRRQDKYGPILDELRRDYEVFHMVVTVPNCAGKNLTAVLNQMYKKFPYLLRYFKGQAKVKNIDFLKYGYAGAVRGLEVTQNQETKEFHPHFHCMILFRKGLKLDEKFYNVYSHKRANEVKAFSELEILMQKIWYLLMNDERVTEKAINELKIGYDVYMTNSEGYYHEAFKYACKGAFDETKGEFLYNEQTFWALFDALDNRRMIQGYGALYNIQDDDGDILEDEADDLYEKIVAALKDFELPSFRVESLDDVIERSAYCLYISRKNIKRVLVDKRDEVLAKHMLLADFADDIFDYEVK